MAPLPVFLLLCFSFYKFKTSGIIFFLQAVTEIFLLFQAFGFTVKSLKYIFCPDVGFRVYRKLERANMALLFFGVTLFSRTPWF